MGPCGSQILFPERPLTTCRRICPGPASRHPDAQRYVYALHSLHENTWYLRNDDDNEEFIVDDLKRLVERKCPSGIREMGDEYLNLKVDNSMLVRPGPPTTANISTNAHLRFVVSVPVTMANNLPMGHASLIDFRSA